MFLPPEKFFLQIASVITKIVGYFFILDGIVVLLVLTPVIFLSQGEIKDKIFFTSIVLIAAIASIFVGVFVLKDSMRYIKKIHAKFKESF